MSPENELALRIAGEGARVLVAVTHTEWRRHFLLGGRSRAIVVCVPHSRWPSASVEGRPDAVIVHLDPNVFTEASLALFLAHLRRDHGSTAIATYCDLNAKSVRLLACAIRSGVETTWIRGHDHLATRLTELLQRNSATAVVAAVLDAIEPVPGCVREAVVRCLQRAFNDALTVGALSSDLLVSRRTLVNRFRAAGYPPPATFITWSRLLVSARLLDDSPVSVAGIARWLHFASASQYRGTLRRYVALTPTELRRLGALATLVARFLHHTASTEPVSHGMTG